MTPKHTYTPEEVRAIRVQAWKNVWTSSLLAQVHQRIVGQAHDLQHRASESAPKYICSQCGRTWKTRPKGQRGDCLGIPTYDSLQELRAQIQPEELRMTLCTLDELAAVDQAPADVFRPAAALRGPRQAFSFWMPLYDRRHTVALVLPPSPWG